MPSRPFSLETIKNELSYDPETGEFRWLKSNSGRRPSLIVGDPHSSGYLRIGFAGKRYLAHRLAWFFMTSEWPAREIDHSNGDRLDNRWANLRLATRAENVRNSKISRNNKCGFKGVNFHRQTKKWVAWIMHNRQKRYLGLFPTPEAAAEAYRRAADELHGEFANHG